MEFHQELRAARARANLTQQQVADALEITKSTYCGYETAKRQPDPQRIKQIAKVLNVSADKLLELDNAQIRKPSETAGAAPEGMSDKELLTAALINIGILKPGQNLTDEDAEIVMSAFRLLEAWFTQKHKK